MHYKHLKFFKHLKFTRRNYILLAVILLNISYICKLHNDIIFHAVHSQWTIELLRYFSTHAMLFTFATLQDSQLAWNLLLGHWIEIYYNSHSWVRLSWNIPQTQEFREIFCSPQTFHHQLPKFGSKALQRASGCLKIVPKDI